MANQVYVNVNGTWRSVSNYYVNVNGTWKTGTEIGTRIGTTYEGMTEAPMYTSGFPTYLQIATLDFAEYMAAPAVLVSAKNGVTLGSTLDLPEYLSRPFWYLDSTFVYSPPSGGGSTPANNLPIFNTTYALDILEFDCVPTLQGFGAKAGIDTSTLDFAEFTVAPLHGNVNNSTYTPPSGGGGTPPPSIMPTVQNLLTLDYAEYLSIPRVKAVAKSGLNTNTLDFAEYMALPHYVMGSAGPTTPALTKTVVYNVEGSGTSPTGIHLTHQSSTYYTTQVMGTGAFTTGNAESIVPSNANLATVTASGKRLVILIASLRTATGSTVYSGTYSGRDGFFNTSGNDLIDIDLGWGASAKSYTANTTLRAWVSTNYNSTSVWTAFTDYATSSENQWYTDLYVPGGATTVEGFGYTYLILDGVSNIEYINSGQTGYWERYAKPYGVPENGYTATNVTSALNVSANNSTNATHALRLAISNCSNLAQGLEMGYSKGATEPTYTTLADYSNGGLDNGTDERHHIEYTFGTHGTQVDMTGNFGNSSSSGTATDGIEGLGLIIGLS